MIISDTHKFAFLHNPKVGGTSVRATIEHLHDALVSFWGSDPDQPNVLIDRAHLGLDEIAALYPDIWSRMRGYMLFCLYRDPMGRFFSSLAEYSKLHGDTDTRFADVGARKATLMRLVETLDGHGAAEALMEHYEFRHFRPQWIYWHAQTDPQLSVRAMPVKQIPTLFNDIAQLTGEPLTTQRRNAGDQLELPGPLARLASSKSIKRRLQNLPGAGAIKSMLRSKYAAPSEPIQRFGLSDPEAREIEQFIARFYAKDRVLWPAENA